MGLVYIIILNWNSHEDTIECIDSCLQLNYRDFRVLVVDNGSTDGSEKILRERFPEVEILQSGKNLGFAGGNNMGLRCALERGADYVWLLNNDTAIEPDSLSFLVQTAQTDSGIGMVGSKIVYHAAPEILWYAGAILDPKRPHRPGHLGLNETDLGQYDKVCETGYVTGCSLLARRETLEAIGLLDDDLFLYFEDVDWSARAKAAGWKLMYCPQSVVCHKVSVSGGGAASPTVLYYTSRNRLYFVEKNYPKAIWKALVYDIYEHFLVNLEKRRFAAAWSALIGVAHFFIGKKGRKV